MIIALHMQCNASALQLHGHNMPNAMNLLGVIQLLRNWHLNALPMQCMSLIISDPFLDHNSIAYAMLSLGSSILAYRENNQRLFPNNR